MICGTLFGPSIKLAVESRGSKEENLILTIELEQKPRMTFTDSTKQKPAICSCITTLT